MQHKTMASKKDSTIRVRVGSETESKLKILSELTNDTPSSIVRQLIEDFVEKHPLANTGLDVSFEISKYPESHPDNWYIFNITAELLGGDSYLEHEELTFLLPEFYDNYGEPYRIDSVHYHRKSFPNCIGQTGRFIGAKLIQRKWKGAIFVYRDKLLESPDIYEVEIKKHLRNKIISGASQFILEKSSSFKDSVDENNRI